MTKWLTTHAAIFYRPHGLWPMPERLPSLYLASTSPRRKLLLEGLGVPFRTIPVDVVEEHPTVSNLKKIILSNALKKANAGLSFSATDHGLFISADTLVVLGNKILGKPKTNRMHSIC